MDVDRHLAALKKALFEQDGRLDEDQHWWPYEVIELCAHSLHPGHEREFAACTLLVIDAVADGYDGSTDLSAKFESMAAVYSALPTELSEEILAAYIRSGQA